MSASGIVSGQYKTDKALGIKAKIVKFCILCINTLVQYVYANLDRPIH